MFSANTSQVASAAALYVEDLFSVYTRTGTGASQTITTGIAADLVVTKGRSGATDWAWYDTARGATYDLVSNSTAAQTTQAQGLTAFGSTGHTWGTLAKVNTNAATYVDFAWKESARFFKKLTVSHTNGSANTVDLSSLGTVGMVAVKRTDSTSDWLVWHRSLTAGNLTYLNLVNAQTADTSLSVSGTTLTIAAALATGTYVVYAWAHDTASDGLIQCGSFTTDGSGNATVTLGWEPQFAVLRVSSAAGNWNMLDASRGWTLTGYMMLQAENSGAEGSSSTAYYTPTATGFSVNGVAPGYTLIYLAIRRGPMRQPTSGSQVYNAIARTGTGAAAAVTGVGFPPDLVIGKDRVALQAVVWEDRLRGAKQALRSQTTGGETAASDSITAFGMDGFTLGADTTAGGYNNPAGDTFVNWCLRRYPGVFDQVCATVPSTATAVAHNLGVVPEMIIAKIRSTTENWEVAHTGLGTPGTARLKLNLTDAVQTGTNRWGSTAPTATAFTIQTSISPDQTIVAYLFATLAGVSKVGSYTGNGTTKQIDCGFSAGARFVLIKRTDSTGDWYVWDSTRGIIAGNDPYLLMNSTAAETTATDYIDPYSAGFELSSTAPAAINANGGTFIYLAFA